MALKTSLKPRPLRNYLSNNYRITVKSNTTRSEKKNWIKFCIKVDFSHKCSRYSIVHTSICQVNWSKRAKFVLAWVFKLTFKESAKSKKVWLHRFETRIGMEVPVNDKKDSQIWIIKSILLINKKTLLNILDTSYVKLWKEIWDFIFEIMCCHLTGLWK